MSRLPTIGERDYGPGFLDWLRVAHNDDGTLKGVTKEFRVDDYGGVGATDSTRIQGAIDAAAVAGGVARCSPRAHNSVSGIIQKQGVRLAGGLGTILNGVAGLDLITIQANADRVGIADLTLSGGENQLVSNSSFTTNVLVKDVDFNAPVNAGIHVVGAIERWYVTEVRAQGGKYFYKHDNTAVGGQNYLDKTHFLNVSAHGQSINGFRIEVAFASDATWTNLNLVTSGQHGFYAAGGIRAFTFINPNTEGIGQTGKENRTTLVGTVPGGATSATLASATGWATGDGMTIAGAGTNGQDFTIVSTALGGPGVTVVGTTVSWAGGTGWTVTNPLVTNAEFDEFQFVHGGIANPAGIQFLGGILGGSGTGGKLRYSVNLNAFAVNFFGTLVAANYPINDPNANAMVYGNRAAPMRRPVAGACIYPMYDGVLPTFNGTPTDANIVGAAVDGLEVLDTSGTNKKWTRVGGLWKSVTLA